MNETRPEQELWIMWQAVTEGNIPSGEVDIDRLATLEHETRKRLHAGLIPNREGYRDFLYGIVHDVATYLAEETKGR